MVEDGHARPETYAVPHGKQEQQGFFVRWGSHEAGEQDSRTPDPPVPGVCDNFTAPVSDWD